MADYFDAMLGDVLPFTFNTYALATGASITLTGLATTDIEIFKNGGATTRASDSGYALIDTDGIDIAGITGYHGFTVDTGNNGDAGFFVVGGRYDVVIASVTVDGAVVNLVVGKFRLTRLVDAT